MEFKFTSIVESLFLRSHSSNTRHILKVQLIRLQPDVVFNLFSFLQVQDEFFPSSTVRRTELQCARMGFGLSGMERQDALLTVLDGSSEFPSPLQAKPAPSDGSHWNMNRDCGDDSLDTESPGHLAFGLGNHVLSAWERGHRGPPTSPKEMFQLGYLQYWLCLFLPAICT